MADDKTLHGPQDASRIALDEDYELRYWKGKFGVSADVLYSAEAAVGNGADAVERHLKNA